MVRYCNEIAVSSIKKLHLIDYKWRILKPMIRILIFILALNAFITPASAQTACGMDMSSEVMQLQLSAEDDAMSDEDMACCSLECISDCTYHFSPFSISSESLIIPKMITFRSFVLSSVPLSELVLPINTPPPLV